MKLLLDTHVAVWAVLGADRLPRAAIDLIETPGNVSIVSVASLWEIALKNNLQRAARDPIGMTVADAKHAFVEAGFEMIAIEVDHLAMVERLEHHHGDPFDRLLVATARTAKARLITCDRRLRGYGDTVMAV